VRVGEACEAVERWGRLAGVWPETKGVTVDRSGRGFNQIKDSEEKKEGEMGRSSDLAMETKGAETGRQSYRLSPEKKMPRGRGGGEQRAGEAPAGYGVAQEEQGRRSLLLVLRQSEEEEGEETAGAGERLPEKEEKEVGDFSVRSRLPWSVEQRGVFIGMKQGGRRRETTCLPRRRMVGTRTHTVRAFARPVWWATMTRGVLLRRLTTQGTLI
jgi:hypothetical protein